MYVIYVLVFYFLLVLFPLFFHYSTCDFVSLNWAIKRIHSFIAYKCEANTYALLQNNIHYSTTTTTLLQNPLTRVI